MEKVGQCKELPSEERVRKIMEKENSLCSKVLNNLKWGSAALLEDIEQDGVVMKEKKMMESPDQIFIWMDGQEGQLAMSQKTQQTVRKMIMCEYGLLQLSFYLPGLKPDEKHNTGTV